MEKSKTMSSKRVAKILCLFFALSVISIVMVYSEFVQGVENFWLSKAEDVSLPENNILSDLIDLDSYTYTDAPCEIDRERMVEEYIENRGGVSVFEEIFSQYLG